MEIFTEQLLCRILLRKNFRLGSYLRSVFYRIRTEQSDFPNFPNNGKHGSENSDFWHFSRIVPVSGCFCHGSQIFEKLFSNLTTQANKFILKRIQ